MQYFSHCLHFILNVGPFSSDFSSWVSFGHSYISIRHKVYSFFETKTILPHSACKMSLVVDILKVHIFPLDLNYHHPSITKYAPSDR